MRKRAEEDWRLLFEEHSRTGLSAAAFCRERKLCAKYFSLRKRQLGSVDSEAPGRSFVPITVTKSTVGIELWVTDRLKLQLPASISPDWLVSLIKGLC